MDWHKHHEVMDMDQSKLNLLIRFINKKSENILFTCLHYIDLTITF